MDVRWRLFVRDVLSMEANSSGEFLFGSPPRPVRALRVLGLVVHRSNMGSESRGLRRDKSLTNNTGMAGVDSISPRCAGVIGVDDGTGVIQVRLPLALWNSVSLCDQVDVVGQLERAPASVGSCGEACTVYLLAEGCHVETDPNIETLRALECIQLYKLCYFSHTWSPSATNVPPLRTDPHGYPTDRSAAGSDPRHDVTWGENPFHDSIASRTAPGADARIPAASGCKSGDTPRLSLEERILAVISSSEVADGGATVEQLHMALGSPLGDEPLAAALEQMQLDGAIYMAGNRYMPL